MFLGMEEHVPTLCEPVVARPMYLLGKEKGWGGQKYLLPPPKCTLRGLLEAGRCRRLFREPITSPKAHILIVKGKGRYLVVCFWVWGNMFIPCDCAGPFVATRQGHMGRDKVWGGQKYLLPTPKLTSRGLLEAGRCRGSVGAPVGDALGM